MLTTDAWRVILDIEGGIGVNSSKLKLGSVAEILVGVTGLGESGEYEYRVIQPNSFSDTGTLDALEIQFREDAVGAQLVLRAGDILVKRLNPSFVYVVSHNEAGAVASQNLLIVRPESEIDPQYLACLLEQKEVIGHVEHVSGTASAIKAISQKKLAEIQIPIVLPAEQRRLGEIWRLARKRKALLREYIIENDKLVSMLVSKIMTGGGE